MLFDLDCFYAQCERVRLGLPLEVQLSLLQWNSVLAVTYPARKCGIKRGDSWHDVAQKSNHECWGIHLPILTRTTTTNNSATTSTSTSNTNTNGTNNGTNSTTNDEETTQAQEEVDDDNDDVNETNNNIASLQEAFDKIYKLSPEEQLNCQQTERGVQKRQDQGKACLERYRIASMRIFSVVLQTLQDRLPKKQFTLERASIDEFYLDITKYCHDPTTTTTTQPDADAVPHNTIVIGASSASSTNNASSSSSPNDPTHHALQKACIVSHWIRTSVWETLGFTMSAGISTNKMMGKLSASYGKPNGQAVLHPHDFNYVLNKTPMNKVRHFGGKLGKQVERILVGNPKPSMGSIQHLSLPILQQALNSVETSQFVFDSCRGIDREVVKETMGALVKSITAFKSFPATSDKADIQNWLQLLATEVVSRVGTDTGRNHRYPKSCTLQYSYFTNNIRQSKSQRLVYPLVSHPSKVPFLVTQAMEKLATIPYSLRGVGLSAGNFEERGTGSGGASIQSLFTKQQSQSQSQSQFQSQSQSQSQFQSQSDQQTTTAWTESSSKDYSSSSLSTTMQTTKTTTAKRRSYQHQSSNPLVKYLTESKAAAGMSSQHPPPSSDQKHPSQGQQTNGQPTFDNCNRVTNDHSALANVQTTPTTTTTTTTIVARRKEDMDLELAKTLQASFDRENYILSTAQKSRPIRKKVRRIDAFFQKR